MAEKFLDIDHLLGKPKNRIARIGIEIEGAWSTKKIPAGMVVQRDGSVFKDEGDDGGTARTGMPGYRVGEISLGPMQPAQLSHAIKKYFPHKIDKSCGMHVHMGFDNVLHYAVLMEEAYLETLIEYLKRWCNDEGFKKDHFIWDRLEGKNHYCQKKFWPDDQARTTGKDYDKERHGHRYTILNYCFKRFQTIECRVLPMMETQEQSIRAVKRVLDITNACLVMLGPKKSDPATGELIMPNERYEERIEEVL